MSLANFNVKNRLNELFSDYLQDDMGFSVLKNMLVSKSSVDFIHQKIKQQIQSIAMQEIKETSDKIETTAYQTQKKEDERESQQDLIQAQLDNSRLMTLQFAIEPLRTLHMAYGKELQEFNASSNTHEHPQTSLTDEHPSAHQKDSHVHGHGQTPQTTPKVHEHPTQEQKNPHVHEHHSAKVTPEELKAKIKEVDDELIKIENEISQIKTRENERSTRESARNFRNSARVAYRSQKGSLKDTLSNDKWQTINYQISTFGQLSSEAANNLVHQAASINYNVLLSQFEFYLSRSKRIDSEINALRSIHTQMQTHLSFESKATVANSNYLSANETWKRKSGELSAAKLKLQNLVVANPALALHNQQLEIENEELQQSYNANIAQVNQLMKPGFILGGFSLLFSVPLILTLTGIIPYFIEPVLLLSLFTAPPALLLAAGIGVGIAALVYGIKAYFNNSSIQSNKNTVTNNVLQSAKNTYQADELRVITIPQLEKQITELQSQKQSHLEQKNQLEAYARNALKTAQEIEPVSVTVLSVFSIPDSHLVHQHPSQANKTQMTPSAPPQEAPETTPLFH